MMKIVDRASIERTLEAELERLGALTVDELRDLLVANHAVGIPRHPEACPIAVYLRDVLRAQHGPAVVVSVGCSFVSIFVGVEFIGNIIRRLPESVRRCAEMFDLGEIPELHAPDGSS